MAVVTWRPGAVSLQIAVAVATGWPAGAQWIPAPVPTVTETDATAPVWFRCFIRVPDAMVTPAEADLWRDSITLSLGGIQGSFTVFLNGQKLAQAEAITPRQRRRFKVPKGILEGKKFNLLALRLEGDAARRGLGMAPILAGYHDELVLEGTWEMLRGEADQLKAVTSQPPTAFFTEAGFRPSSTPLAQNAELFPGARLPPAESLAKMQPADDLAVDLVLSEPQVAQPTHLSFDERGRLWVAQYRQYPYPAGVRQISRDKYYRARFDRVPPAPPHHDRGGDRITVHEDTNADGIYDSHRIVLDGLNMANAVLRGHGGLWIMHTPYLLFYPDANGDDVPDRDPEVRLAGFGLEDTHSVANGLAWGPDGWLYGAQGSTTTSRILRPGLDPPAARGVYFEGCMVWRYHPRSRTYEIFAEGGGNVFELDFDSEGRLHSGHNGGDTRGWHYVQSGLYLKQGVDPGKFGPPANPFAFGHLDMMKSLSPVPRFSHATIVADGTALPPHYAGRFFAADPLHRKVVVAERYRKGATFETSDSRVALAGADPGFRPVYLANAPDGAIYVADFCEEFIAHGQHYQGQIDPESGRVYRIRGRESALNREVNLSTRTPAELVELLGHGNRWHRQTAVRLLGERREAASIDPLRKSLADPATHPALEALWALHQMEALDEATALTALEHPAAPVRAWTVRLAGDRNSLTEKFFAAVLRGIAAEPDAEVRCQIASSARRLPSKQALPLVAALLRRDTDQDDPFIPLLCWWAIESHCSSDREAVLAALPWEPQAAKKHILGRLMRRFAMGGKQADLLACAHLLERAPSNDHRQLLMRGFEEAFKGLAVPSLPDELIASLGRHGLASPRLRARLGEREAMADVVKTIGDAKTSVDERLLCVRLAGEVKLPDAVKGLLRIAKTDEAMELRKAALSALLLYEGDDIGREIAVSFPQLPSELQPTAQTLLTSRPAWSLTFLKLVEAGSVQPSQLPPNVVDLLRSHEDSMVAALANRLFTAPPAKPDHRATISRVLEVLSDGAGDPYKGESIYAQRCAVCHTLFFKGGRVGPDLTAFQRDDLGTLLPSLIDPNAEIREGYAHQILTTKDGRSVSGFVADGNGAVLVLRALDGQDVTVPRGEVRELRPTGRSLMPEGLLEGLSDQQIRDFFAYLRLPQPITR
ncbi:MAG: DUF7133 domain-containing protein [Verrucomicrobiales bacterium]